MLWKGRVVRLESILNHNYLKVSVSKDKHFIKIINTSVPGTPLVVAEFYSEDGISYSTTPRTLKEGEISE